MSHLGHDLYILALIALIALFGFAAGWVKRGDWERSRRPKGKMIDLGTRRSRRTTAPW